MLIEQTLDKLATLRLKGMVEAFRQWARSPSRSETAPEDLLGMLADAEWTSRENRKLTRRLQGARFREPACIEDIDYAHPRGLKKATIMDLASSRWIADHRCVIITGLTGVGKTYLACALGNKACRDGYGTLYFRAPRLFDDLARAQADGTIGTLFTRLAKTPLLILDDFGTEPLDKGARRNLRELMEDRYGLSTTLITSQLDPKDWHAVIGDETIADAICDRVVHGAVCIKLTGESLRKHPIASSKRDR
jgi:DNA replication protein DnaC